jgi:(E)-4-hydroxy-3-methylbut-2-enyl-diphosphate synthase
MKTRRKSVPVRVGDVVIGGAAEIVVQSMTKADTRDIKATLNEIARLKDARCRIVRVAVPTKEAALAMVEIKKASPLPIIADIHYDAPLALMALEAGVDGLRLNPGNIKDPEKVKEITRRAKEREIPIRIGVNAGSLPGRPKEGAGVRPPIDEVVTAMVNAALGHIHILESLDFNLIKVSMKASDPPTMIAANRAIADKIAYPLHLGVTEAGPPRTGAVKSAVGIGVLLEEGIGDTIRVSLAGDSVEEVEVGYGIVSALAEKLTGPNLIACPMCGRLEIDMLPMVAEVEKALKRIKRPINVSVMGCVVNGPGEGQHADIGIAGGKNKGILFKHGKIVGTFPEKELVPALLRELDAIAKEDEQNLAS